MTSVVFALPNLDGTPPTSSSPFPFTVSFNTQFSSLEAINAFSFKKKKKKVYIFSVFEMQINFAFFPQFNCIVELTSYQHIKLLLCF